MKKEHYFTSSNREKKIAAWISECKDIKPHRPFVLDLNKAVLLVLDMQKYFLDEDSHAFIPSAAPIIPTIISLINQLEKTEGIIVYTRHITSENPEDKMKKWWRGIISPQDDKSAITSALETNNRIIITKNKYSAFYGTNLEEILKEKEIEQVIITGVMTHLCCETTARDAFMRDFEIFFVLDATATYNEQLHRGTLRAISHGFGVCISSEEILQWFKD
ncbi:MAG: isochorismatase family protein [Candidatus Hodarchaeota archaeon]